MDTIEKASKYFSEGFNCAQAVFCAIAEQYGLDKETALKIASGFGGGMGRMQKTCGAVTGAILAIGYIRGYHHPEAGAEKEITYALTRELLERFTQLHATTECSELLGQSLMTEEGKACIKELNLTESVCSNCVKDAVILAEDLIRNGL